MIYLFTRCFNEAPLVNWFIKHYRPMVDHITVVDHGSTDDAHLSALDAVRNDPHITVEFEQYDADADGYCRIAGQRLLESYWRKVSSSRDDWCVVVDFDEFLYADSLKDRLRDAHPSAHVVTPIGYNMVHHEWPSNLSQVERGQRHYGFDKPVIFRMDCIDKVQHGDGCHNLLNHESLMVVHSDRIQLRHMRYLGLKYVIKRRLQVMHRVGFNQLAGDLVREAAEYHSLLLSPSAGKVPSCFD